VYLLYTRPRVGVYGGGEEEEEEEEEEEGFL
jgi:hypothetical protein